MISLPPIVLDKNPSIIFIHGWNGSEASNMPYIDLLTQKGYICMNFDLPGHGASDTARDTLSRKDYLEFILTKYDELAARNDIDKNKISVFGSSFGGYLAILLSSKRAVEQLALRVPANYMDDGFDQPQTLSTGENDEVVLWRQNKLSRNDSMSLEALAQFEGNVLLVESEYDELLPHQAIQNYIDVIERENRLTYILMKDTQHHLESEDKEKFAQILYEWF